MPSNLSSDIRDWPEIDSDFQFECTLCGECCRGSMEVFLDPYDLYRMARHLGFNHTRLLFSQNLVELVPGQHGVFMPRIRFKRKPMPFCPFLMNELTDEQEVIGKCRLHPQAKPLICSLAPVAHEFDAESGEARYYLVDPVPGCPGMKLSKRNNLNEVVSLYENALKNRERFFTLLEDLKDKDHPEAFYMDRLYHFETDEPFSHP